MNGYPADHYTEPTNIDVDTLRNLGPLAAMAGIWEGARGLDVKPKANGPQKQAYIERIELQPIDPQTNGPQLFYGLRYHSHVVKPDQAKTYHDQVGYWLWEPANGTIIQTVTIPRGQTVMAAGRTKLNSNNFELVAVRGSETWGISSNPFLDFAFKTVEYRIRISINPDGTWSYESDAVMLLHDKNELFHHVDRNLLTKVADPTPNPMALEKR